MGVKNKTIDLEKSLDLNNNTFYGLVSFTAQPLSQQNLNELAGMAELLKKVGMSIEVTHNETDSGLAYDFIVMKVNKEQYNTSMTRRAGRKADFNTKYDTYGKCTVAELSEKQKTMSKTKIAEELGCSRMTLYRILKNIETRNPDGDSSIWHYTS